MQNQRNVAVVLPLATSNRATGTYVTDNYPKAEMPRIAFQVDFTAGSANGTTAALQIQGSLDGSLWRDIGSATNITLSAGVRGAIVESTTASPNVRLSVTTAVNPSNFSVMAFSSM